MIQPHSSSPTSQRGRPRTASRLLLEDAAFELFLEQGYTKTTIDDVAQRAGVSRNTFFNYFDSKSDVFWADIDRALTALPRNLAEVSSELSPIDAIGHAFIACGRDLGSTGVPWILSHFETIGKPDDIMESAMKRFSAINSSLRTFISQRLALPESELLPQLMASVSLAAVVSSALSWASAGVRREPLDAYILRALAPIASGFSAAR